MFLMRAQQLTSSVPRLERSTYKLCVNQSNESNESIIESESSSIIARSSVKQSKVPEFCESFIFKIPVHLDVQYLYRTCKYHPSHLQPPHLILLCIKPLCMCSCSSFPPSSQPISQQLCDWHTLQ